MEPPVDISDEPQKLLHKASSSSSSDMTAEMHLKLLRDAATPEPPHPYRHVLALPLVQIFSVCVHTDSLAGSPSEVYGSIQATEGKGTSFDLYDRDLTEPDTILEHGTLSLSGPENDVILGTTRVTIDVCLKDRNRTRDMELIKGQFYLDPVTEGIEKSYDKLMKALIQGERGFAYLYYTTFRFAVSAIVEVTITEKSDGSSCFTDVYGSVVACYANSRQYCISDDESKYLETVLFEKPSGQPVRVMVGTPIKLLRSVVAVPAYSSLIIKANMSEAQGQLASGLVEFPVQDGAGFTESIKSKNGCVQVKVKIRNAYPRIYEQRKLKSCTTVVVSQGTQSSESKAEEPSKKARALSNQQLPSSLKLGGAPQVAKQSKIWGCLMVEVFSVYIGGINREVSALCGTIKVDDGSVPFFIYESGLNDSEILPDDKIVCIKGNTPIGNSEFRLILDLKDPTLNLEVSRGDVSWNSAAVNSAYSISWYNKRICSVVQGAQGYAAIHYMIFKSALSAIVEVTFFCDNFVGVTTNLYGVLLARYGGHEYSSDYEKKYYQSSLFNRPQKNAVQLNTKSRVPLSKSLVAVPINSSLVVEADLRAMCDGNSHEEAVFGVVEFVVDQSRTSCKEIRGGICHIEVSVKFRRPY